MTKTTDPGLKATVQADRALEAFLALSPLPRSNKTLTLSYLLSLVDITEPTEITSKANFIRNGLFCCQFVDRFRWQVLARTSRWLDNVWGEGYRLMDPSEVMPDAERDLYEKVYREFGQFSKKARFVDDRLLTPEERKVKVDAVSQAAGICQQVNHSRKLTEAKAKRLGEARQQAGIIAVGGINSHGFEINADPDQGCDFTVAAQQPIGKSIEQVCQDAGGLDHTEEAGGCRQG